MPTFFRFFLEHKKMIVGMFTGNYRRKEEETEGQSEGGQRIPLEPGGYFNIQVQRLNQNDTEKGQWRPTLYVIMQK